MAASDEHPTTTDAELADVEETDEDFPPQWWVVIHAAVGDMAGEMVGHPKAKGLWAMMHGNYRGGPLQWIRDHPVGPQLEPGILKSLDNGLLEDTPPIDVT